MILYGSIEAVSVGGILPAELFFVFKQVDSWSEQWPKK
jgi:hypothetical protein